MSPGGNPNSYQERIIRDKEICGGEPVFKGTRVTLRMALASLAEGDSVADILTDFPSLTAGDSPRRSARPLRFARPMEIKLDENPLRHGERRFRR